MKKEFVVTASALNVRSEPSIEGPVIDILDKGEKVNFIESSNDGYWVKISAEGAEGWVSFKYLQPIVKDVIVSAFPWFDIAVQELRNGIAEILGPAANPRIVEYLHSTSLGAAMASSDETAWCSAFVNFCVEKSGYAGTDSAAARSWLKWGGETLNPVPGSIVVFSRGNDSFSGHVAFYVSETVNGINVLGGNQGNKVCYGEYSRDRLFGYRLPKIAK